MKYWRVIASVLLLAFLLFSPAPLQRAMQRDPTRELFENEAPEWYGVIEIWHIAGFRTYQGSVTNFLQEQCSAFSRKHPGVHFEVTGLTPEMYENRIARGLRPDAYSFPAGFLESSALRTVSASVPILRDGIAVGTDADDSSLAVPYLSSGYFLLLNEQRALQDGGTLPDRADAALLSSLADRGELSFPAAFGAAFGLSGTSWEYADFLAGRCTAAIADARSLGDLLRSTEQNLVVTALPLSGFTDEVLYLAAAKDTDDRRVFYIGALSEYLLSETVQRSVTSLGAMPVRKYLDGVRYGTRLLEAWYAAYLESTKTTDPFREPR